MIGRVIKEALTTAVVLAVCAQAFAGLATDPNAYVDGDSKTWAGSVAYSDPGETGLSGIIEYAVFAPGDFDYPGYTPTPGEFVYAYQIINEGAKPVSALLVTMLDSNEANNIGTFEIAAGDIAPDNLGFVGAIPNLGSAQWNWSVSGLGGAANGVQSTTGLVYSSINAPLDLFGTIQDGGAQAQMILPSPSDVIPEPTVAMLLAGGVFAMIRRK